MTEQKTSGRRRAVASHLAWTVISGLLFGLTVSLATRRCLISLITGLAMSSAIEAAYLLDGALLQPRLKRLSYDWLRFGLEIVSSLLGHIGGAGLALLACGWLFRFSIWDTRAWWAVVGMVLGFPVIHGTESALRLYRQLKAREQLEERLRAMATEAELKALKAQINPHFLFNTLNTIAALIHTDPALAEASVERLAQMFRHALASSERPQVPLEEELAFVDDYLEIERARFGKRLRVTREIDSRALGVPVPSLILQPLVENAIRHGCGDDGGADIDVQIKSVGHDVTITIADRGPGIPPGYEIGGDLGHGLRNVDERLRKLYGHGLEFHNNTPHGTTVTVKIPSREN
ncbi:MAG: histidine kinase [Thermoflexales bacterium]|nr:histidine kinase [Thermoflexales bacterium]